MGRYELNATTVDGTQHTLRASATLTYADTNTNALVEPSVYEVEYYKDIVIEVKVTSLSNTTAQTLTIAAATSNYLVTCAEAIAAFETKDGQGDVLYYKFAIAANDICGKYLYLSSAYGADPTGDPAIEIMFNAIQAVR